MVLEDGVAHLTGEQPTNVLCVLDVQGLIQAEQMPQSLQLGRCGISSKHHQHRVARCHVNQGERQERYAEQHEKRVQKARRDISPHQLREFGFPSNENSSVLI